jgi:hypothetical protein
MKTTSYAVLVATFVVGATLVRLYGPNNYSLTFLSAGVQRGVPVKIVTFWVLMTIAIGVAIFGLFRRRHAG